MVKVKYNKESLPGTTTNRDVFGTWIRPFDFTLTMIGYTVGIHDFWRFPYLCYKFGGVFIIPFVILNFIMAIPTTFMEFTIGQYRGIGATEVFGVMAPILTGVSYLLAWNSLTTCWVYTMMIAWSRLYSSDATSCTQGWGTCLRTSYYNTKACYTGDLDDRCARDNTGIRNETELFYDFDCITLDKFCERFNATMTSNESAKNCIDAGGNVFSVYTKRLHASVEYYYGGISGLTRDIKNNSQNQPVSEDLLIVDVNSTIESEISAYSLTTFAILCLFLYEDLLSVSFITYLLNAVPFLALPYFTARAYWFSNSGRGIEVLFDTLGSFETLLSPEIWVEAIIQILSTAGIGNGVLINLSTFNSSSHGYIVDGILATALNILCSICTAIICFCTIGHYLDKYEINIPFNEFIRSKSSHSSLEFGYIVYTQFIVLLIKEHYTIVIFFLMITSFSTDSALRLVQNLLDAMVAIFPRFRRHRFATLVGICLFGYFAIQPMTRNGGVILFMEYEYFLLKFVWPFIVLVQVVGVTWVYKTSRLLDNAEQMGIKMNGCLRLYYTVCLQYLTVVLLLFAIIYNMIYHERKRFDNVNSPVWHELFGWVFVLTPAALLALSVFEQLIVTEREKWPSLFVPIPDAAVSTPKVGRYSGISASKYGPIGSHPVDGVDIHRILQRWHHTNLSESGNPEGEQKPGYVMSEGLAEVLDEAGISTTKRKRLGWCNLREHWKKVEDYFDDWPGRFDDSDKSDLEDY